MTDVTRTASGPLTQRYGSADYPGRPVARRRPPGASDATIAALGKLSEALEVVEEARGLLYGFHRLSGTADRVLQDAVAMLREAGHDRLADDIAETLVGRIRSAASGPSRASSPSTAAPRGRIGTIDVLPAVNDGIPPARLTPRSGGFLLQRRLPRGVVLHRLHRRLTCPPARRPKRRAGPALRSQFTSQVNQHTTHVHFWSPSYLAASCGGAPLSIIGSTPNSRGDRSTRLPGLPHPEGHGLRRAISVTQLTRRSVCNG
jgi:hypothetical protein